MTVWIPVSLQSRSLFVLAFVFLCINTASAQIDTSDQNFSESKAILSEIKKANDFRKGSGQIRSGLMSLSSNLGDPLKLNSKNQMPFVSIEADFELGALRRGLGINLETTIGQNILGGTKSTSANTSSSQIIFYQLGPRYRFVFDETNIKDYFQIKLQYHAMTNNFKFTTQDATALSYPKSHSAVLIGFERSIPATRDYDFRAGLDLFYIMDTKEIESLNETEKSGRGIQMKGEIFYNLKPNSRLGGIYSLSHFVNKFTDQVSSDTGKSSSTHTYRYLGVSYSLLF